MHTETPGAARHLGCRLEAAPLPRQGLPLSPRVSPAPQQRPAAPPRTGPSRSSAPQATSATSSARVTWPRASPTGGSVSSSASQQVSADTKSPLALPGTPPWETIPEETPASEPVPTLPRPPTTTLLQATFSLLICTGGGQSPAHRFLPGSPWGQLFQISEPQLPYL